jgi:hypothetical protein
MYVLQDGEARVRVEIHPVEVTTVDSDDMGLAPPSDPVGTESKPLQDMAPVLSFLSGKNCLDGVSLSTLHNTHMHSTQFTNSNMLLNTCSNVQYF